MAMDSGSLQSSSGGEEEYDSRATFLNPSSHLGLVSPSSSTLFDHHGFQQSLATALTSQYNNNTTNNNNGFVWPLGLRSEPNYQPPLLHPHHQPLVETTNVVGHSPPSDQPKNPKKRTRASRRAPTTVLTTDTTNFRQMVQEFTGIPAGPFSGGGGGGSLYSRRLDLFSTAGSSMRTAHSLKPQMPSFIPSSSNTNFAMEDQILTFHPLLQPPSSLPLSLKNQLGSHEANEPVFGSKSQLPSMDALEISHEQASGFLGSDQAIRNCATSSSALDKGLENVVCSRGDGDPAASSWTCPN